MDAITALNVIEACVKDTPAEKLTFKDWPTCALGATARRQPEFAKAIGFDPSALNSSPWGDLEFHECARRLGLTLDDYWDLFLDCGLTKASFLRKLGRVRSKYRATATTAPAA